jgi:hypothetical protein
LHGPGPRSEIRGVGISEIRGYVDITPIGQWAVESLRALTPPSD